MVSLNVINISCAMSMIFRFRMLSDENDNFVRDYEVPYDMTLLDFHRFLLESLEYEECMTSFFTADVPLPPRKRRLRRSGIVVAKRKMRERRSHGRQDEPHPPG